MILLSSPATASVWVPIWSPFPIPAPVYGPPVPPHYQQLLELLEAEGYIANPWIHDVVHELREAGALTEADLVDYDLYYRAWSLRTPQGEVPFRVVFKQERQEKSTGKKVVGAVAAVGSTFFGACIWPYMVDPTLHFDPEARHRPLCADMVRRLTGSDEAAATVDGLFGRTAESIILRGRIASAYATGRSVLVLVKDQPEASAYRQFREVRTSLDVAPRIVDSRLVIPIGQLRLVGLQVHYDAGRITIQDQRGRTGRYLVGSLEAEVDGQRLYFDVAPFLDGNRVLAPVRPTIGQFCDGIDYQLHSRRMVATCD